MKKVYHRRYGYGWVEEYIPYNNKYICRVVFEDVGVKYIYAEYLYTK